MNIRDLLEQNKIWITADRIPLTLEEMDDEHRAATLAMLRRRAEYQRKMYYKVEERMMLFAPDDVYAQWQAQKVRELDSSAEEWMERRPLIIELARLVRRDQLRKNTVDGDVIVREIEK